MTFNGTKAELNRYICYYHCLVTDFSLFPSAINWVGPSLPPYLDCVRSVAQLLMLGMSMHCSRTVRRGNLMLANITPGAWPAAKKKPRCYCMSGYRYRFVRYRKVHCWNGKSKHYEPPIQIYGVF